MDASQKKKIEKIAFKHSGNMKQAVKEIERIRKGLSDNPDVVDILRRANEEVESIEGEGLDEARKYQGRSRRQVHKTMIFKRRNRAKDRQKKLKMKVKRRKSTWKIKRKRNEIRRHKKFGGGDRSGRSGKIGAARKRRGGRSITAKG
jgi:predicted Zn-dependent protease